MTHLVARSPRQLATTPGYRWDPSREVEDLQDRLGQLVQGFFGDGTGVNPMGRGSAWVVPVDIEETDNAYIVELDLPNVRAEDVNVELNDDELRVFGEYKKRERKGVLRRQTRKIGEFEFVIALPGDINPDDVDADLSDGVLTIKVGKAVNNRPRRIEVRGA